MKKNLIKLAPLALVACVGTAFADDSSVTLYGILDTGIANVSHSFSFSPNFPVAVNPTVNHGTQSATGMLNGGLSATRWGLKGTEEISSDLKALFLVESGFNVGSGAISNAVNGLATNTSNPLANPQVAVDSAVSGQLFNRGAYVGLASKTYGQVTFGRQQSFFLDNIAVFDPMSGSQMFSPIGFSGSYGGGGFTDDSRADNSVKYKLAVGDVTLGALYKFGGVAGSSASQSAYQFNAVYASGPLALEAGYEQFKDAFSLSNGPVYCTTTAVTGCSTATAGATVDSNTITATAADTKAFMLAAKYVIDASKTDIRGGFEREELSNPSNPTLDAAIGTVFGTTVRSVSTSAYYQQENLNVYWLGVDQPVTSSLTAMAAAYHVHQSNWAGGTTASTSCLSEMNKYCSGSLNYYSLVGDYRLSKRTDVYAGVMLALVSGGPAAAQANAASAGGVSENTNRTVAVGFRHTF